MSSGRNKHWRVWFLRTAGVLAGLFCLAAGIRMGQQDSVWLKGIYICLECIGIG